VECCVQDAHLRGLKSHYKKKQDYNKRYPVVKATINDKYGGKLNEDILAIT